MKSLLGSVNRKAGGLTAHPMGLAGLLRIWNVQISNGDFPSLLINENPNWNRAWDNHWSVRSETHKNIYLYIVYIAAETSYRWSCWTYQWGRRLHINCGTLSQYCKCYWNLLLVLSNTAVHLLIPLSHSRSLLKLILTLSWICKKVRSVHPTKFRLFLN